MASNEELLDAITKFNEALATGDEMLQRYVNRYNVSYEELQDQAKVIQRCRLRVVNAMSTRMVGFLQRCSTAKRLKNITELGF